MWSLTQRFGVCISQNIQILRSVAAPAGNTLRLFSGFSRIQTLPSTQLGVSAIISEPSSQLLRLATSPLVQLANGFKIKGRLKRRCKDCYFVVRQERMYVMCKSHGRHKQMAMKQSEKNSWILTDATQSKFRAW